MISIRRLLIVGNIIIAIFIGFSVFGCHKNPTKPGILQVLIGNWAWVYSYGGYGGQYIYPDSAGYDRTLNIARNGIYTEIVDDSIAYRERFQVVEKPVYGKLYNVLIIDNYPHELIIDRVDADTLILYEYCDDCFSHTYIRLHPI